MLPSALLAGWPAAGGLFRRSVHARSKSLSLSEATRRANSAAAAGDSTDVLHDPCRHRQLADLPQHRIARPGAHVEAVGVGELPVLRLLQAVSLGRDRRGQQIPFPRAERSHLEVQQHDLAVVGQQVPGVGVSVDRPGRQGVRQLLELVVQLVAAGPQEVTVLAGDAARRGEAGVARSGADRSPPGHMGSRRGRGTP